MAGSYNVGSEIIRQCEIEMNSWTKKSPGRSRKGSGKSRIPKAHKASSPTLITAQPKELRPRTFKRYTSDKDSQSEATHEDSPDRGLILRPNSESRSHEIQSRKPNDSDGKENVSSKSDFRAPQHMKSKSFPESSKAKRMSSNGDLYAEGARIGPKPGTKDKRIKAQGSQHQPNHKKESDEAAAAMMRLSHDGTNADNALENFNRDEIDAASALIDLSRVDTHHHQ